MSDGAELDCAACFEWLHAFLDGELDEQSAEAVQGHLEACAACFERGQLEEAFRRAIRSAAATPAPAPPELEQRIRRALDQDEARGRESASDPARQGATPWTSGAWASRAWASRAWSSWTSRVLVAAAAGLVAVATFSALAVPKVGGGPSADVKHPAFLRGELVCLDCLLLATELPRSGLDVHLPPPPEPSADTADHRPLRLRDEDGRVWELLARPETAAVLGQHENTGREVLVAGALWPALGVVSVARLDLD